MFRPLGTKAYLALALGLLLVILSVVVVIFVNSTMKRLALADAEQATRMLLDHNLAIHTYFSQDLKPKLFEQLGPTTSKDYFEPAWMSSTYAIRKIDGYFHHSNQSPYYYKECAINARSPENEADNYEKAFLADLQKDSQLTTKSAIRVLDGKPYFTLLRRGEVMEESCLRCHSTPEQAPGDLVRHYGPERSFHRKVQDVAQAISIRIPLSDAFSTATGFSYYLSGFLLVALGIGFFFVWVGNKRMVIDPMARIQEHAVKIASEPESLGDVIPEPKLKELRDLAAAFNQMSVALRKSHDELEQRVLERTQKLAAANQELEKEVEKRGRAEKKLQKSEQELRLTLAATTGGIWMWNFKTNEIFFSERYYTMLGYQPGEFPASYVAWSALIHPDDRDDSIAGAQKYLETKPDLYENQFRLRTKDGQYRWIHSRARVVERDDAGEAIRIIGNHEDITERKRAEDEKSAAILELEKALAEVKKLSGFLPICASCKKIRDDQGYWRQIEAYIRDHSEAQFTHGICPECARKLYPECTTSNRTVCAVRAPGSDGSK